MYYLIFCVFYKKKMLVYILETLEMFYMFYDHLSKTLNKEI